MITFECQDCKATVSASESQAGKAMSCPKCFFMLVVPGAALVSPIADTSPSTAPGSPAAGQQASTAARPFRLRGIFLVPILIVAGLVTVALCLMGIQRVREAAARSVSKNNLREIALGFHRFHDANKRLPFNGGASEVPGRRHSARAQPGALNSGSWAFQILPYVGQASLFQSPDERMTPVPLYLCPGRNRPAWEAGGGGAWSDYFYNNYLNDPEQASDPAARDLRRHFGHLKAGDGAANTVMIGHGNICTNEYQSAKGVTLSGNIFVGGTANTTRAGNNGMANPTGVTLSRDSAQLPGIGSWGGPFPSGALMAMGDASVRTFPYTTDNFGAFLTPSGGEKVVPPDK